MSHFLFPCLEYEAVSIVRDKLRVEKGKDVGEGRGAPSKKAVVRRTTVAQRRTYYFVQTSMPTHQ